MARPMILIKHSLLDKLYKEAQQGVPISFLIRKYMLSITNPTLAQLIRYYDTIQQEATPPSVRQIIISSLFPEWLANSTEDIMYQNPSEYRYRGKMPLGQWERLTVEE